MVPWSRVFGLDPLYPNGAEGFPAVKRGALWGVDGRIAGKNRFEVFAGNRTSPNKFFLTSDGVSSPAIRNAAGGERRREPIYLGRK